MKKQSEKKETPEGKMRLNKYLAHSGIASRRKADEFIEQGLVTVNGEVVKEMGFHVKDGDVVTFKGKKITPVKNYVYILLNKPKDYITTTSDDLERKTVMELIKNATRERVYPVGRLDRNTTGLLLLTNDGEMMERLTHPKYEIRKMYEVELDRPLMEENMKRIAEGVELEDGIANVDEIEYAHRSDKRIIGVQLHSGKNRVVRRIFEAMHYDVKKLDRVMYAGLTKKDLPRGKWRLLTEKEVILLKHFKNS
jgi:23S rRNA pseudouridine2605 synthase